MENDKTINLGEENKILIVQAVQNGLEQFKEYKLEHKTITSLGSTGTKWDKINTECSYALPKLKFDVVACKRGVWQLILIYDKDTKHLYTLMKEQRFDELLKSVKENKVHYLEALTMCNADLVEEYREQTTLFEGFNDIKKEKIDKTLEIMLSKINGEIERHVLVRFTDKEFALSSITASVITPRLSIVTQENWAQYIQPKYDIAISALNEFEVDEEEINLTLKVAENNDTYGDVEVKVNKEKRNNLI